MSEGAVSYGLFVRGTKPSSCCLSEGKASYGLSVRCIKPSSCCLSESEASYGLSVRGTKPSNCCLAESEASYGLVYQRHQAFQLLSLRGEGFLRFDPSRAPSLPAAVLAGVFQRIRFPTVCLSGAPSPPVSIRG